MIPVQPVAADPADLIVLDAAMDQPSVGQDPVPGDIKIVGFKHLQLERQGQSILGPPGTSGAPAPHRESTTVFMIRRWSP